MVSYWVMLLDSLRRGSGSGEAAGACADAVCPVAAGVAATGSRSLGAVHGG